jgi:hypothetical protein
VVFNRDVRPILSDTCFHCHGFEASKRKAKLRLDIAEGATESRGDGRPAVRPGNRAGSELWVRITTQDSSDLMPPPDSGKKLTAEQVAILGRWIDQGANYQKHWAFETPIRRESPPVRRGDWVRNDIDRFVLATLEAKGLVPQPEARRESLIRRVTIDLTGLPPTLAEVDAFLADTQPGAYERLVDRLLASPRYGEHMARYWLDAARYGDTHGLHLDNERSMWPYRDWVVDAFNRNLPFDQFTLWQLAGDLLPEPTREQQIASGFNRCNVTTSEGGAIDEEFQARYAVDRVETTATVWMGLTMGCAVCHDHKLDPISQKDFYQVYSLFNNLTEAAMDGNALLPPPVLALPTPEQEQRLKDIEGRLATADKRMREATTALQYTDPATITNAPRPQPADQIWVDDDFPAGAKVATNEGNEPNRWVAAAEGQVRHGQRSILRAGTGLHQVFFSEASQPLTVHEGDRLFAHVYIDPARLPKAIMLQYNIGGAWSHRANWGDPDAIAYGTKATPEKVLMGALPEAGRWVRLEVDVAKLGLAPGTRIGGMAFTQFDGAAWWDEAGLFTANDPACDPAVSLLAWERAEKTAGDSSKIPADLKDLLKKAPADRDAAAQRRLREYYLEHVHAGAGEPIVGLRAERVRLREERKTVQDGIVSTMVSKELDKPRPAHVLIRGQYDQKGEAVGPGVPAVLPPLPASSVTNRLTLARWLVDGRHPLTARVTVNRVWQQFFGTGLVKTAEDFGSKGEWPSHPELLDWLATEFVRKGWDVKGMARMLVTSATYRQDSKVTREVLAADPENRLLAHAPRLRLDAEVLRDNALFVSGLLVEKRGGRGVRPYQPAGIWEAVGYTTSNTAKFSQDHGEALYRRSLYTFWKRTAPPPSMTTFDTPSREQCRVRRERTNTPLQALVTLNDPQYAEAARHLGHRMLTQGGTTDADRLRCGFRLVTARTPRDTELAVLAETLAQGRTQYAADPAAAGKVATVGESPAPGDVPAPELAAYTMVASLLLNLDETLTRN